MGNKPAVVALLFSSATFAPPGTVDLGGLVLISSDTGRRTVEPESTRRSSDLRLDPGSHGHALYSHLPDIRVDRELDPVQCDHITLGLLVPGLATTLRTLHGSKL